MDVIKKSAYWFVILLLAAMPLKKDIGVTVFVGPFLDDNKDPITNLTSDSLDTYKILKNGGVGDLTSWSLASFTHIAGGLYSIDLSDTALQEAGRLEIQLASQYNVFVPVYADFFVYATNWYDWMTDNGEVPIVNLTTTERAAITDSNWTHDTRTLTGNVTLDTTVYATHYDVEQARSDIAAVQGDVTTINGIVSGLTNCDLTEVLANQDTMKDSLFAGLPVTGFSTFNPASDSVLTNMVSRALTTSERASLTDSVWGHSSRKLTSLDEDSMLIDLNASTIGTVTTVTNGVSLTTAERSSVTDSVWNHDVTAMAPPAAGGLLDGLYDSTLVNLLISRDIQDTLELNTPISSDTSSGRIDDLVTAVGLIESDTSSGRIDDIITNMPSCIEIADCVTDSLGWVARQDSLLVLKGVSEAMSDRIFEIGDTVILLFGASESMSDRITYLQDSTRIILDSLRDLYDLIVNYGDTLSLTYNICSSLQDSIVVVLDSAFTSVLFKRSVAEALLDQDVSGTSQVDGSIIAILIRNRWY